MDVFQIANAELNEINLTIETSFVYIFILSCVDKGCLYCLIRYVLMKKYCPNTHTHTQVVCSASAFSYFQIYRKYFGVFLQNIGIFEEC